MTQEEQVLFITELIDNVKADILKDVDKLPKEWDGRELRQLIANRFSDVVIKGTMSPKRKRNFINWCLVNQV